MQHFPFDCGGGGGDRVEAIAGTAVIERERTLRIPFGPGVVIQEKEPIARRHSGRAIIPFAIPEIRAVLEGLAMRLAISNISPSTLEDMEHELQSAER